MLESALFEALRLREPQSEALRLREPQSEAPRLGRAAVGRGDDWSGQSGIDVMGFACCCGPK